MRGLLALVVVTGATGGIARAQVPALAPVEEDLDVPGQSSTELRGDALVWEDARFYLEPWDGGTSIQFGALSRLRRDEVGRAMPVRIVDASLRAFVEVELPNRSDCTVRRLEPDPRIASLRLFVKRTDLSPVLVKPYTVTFGNGTSVKLAPGVAVVPTSTGHYLISLRGDKLRLAIPHASVGYVYAHKPVTDAVLKAPVVRIDRNQVPRIDDVPFDVRQYWVAPKPVRTSSENVLLKLTARCMEVVVSVPASGVRPAEVPTPYPNRAYPPIPAAPLAWRIPVGAPLSTVDKREVAVAAEAIAVEAPADDRACFDARITLWPTEDRAYNSPSPRTFRLCAPAGVVEQQPASTTIGDELDIVGIVERDMQAPPADVAKPPAHAMKTPLGVHYTYIGPRKKGGVKPTAASTVTVHYTGWTTDGKMFDSSRTRGVAATFALQHLVAGWTDGLQVMHVGEKVRFWIPEALAYGGKVGRPKGMLVFDVELLAIQ